MKIKKTISDIYRIASELDASGYIDLADACDTIAEDILVSVAYEGTTKEVVKARTWSAGGAKPMRPRTRKTTINPKKPTIIPGKTRRIMPGVAGVAGLLGGSAIGRMVGGGFGDSHSEQEWNANVGSNVGMVGGEVAAKEVAKRMLLGPGSSTLRGAVSGVPAAAGGAAGSMIGGEIGYELGGEAGELVGGFAGWAAGAKATQMAGAGLAAAKGTLAGAGAAGAAGVALAGALGFGLGKLITTVNPVVGSYWGNWLYENFGKEDPVFVDQIWGYLEKAKQACEAKDVNNAIRYIAQAYTGLNMYLSENRTNLSKREWSGAVKLREEIHNVVASLPPEAKAEYKERAEKLGAKLR